VESLAVALRDEVAKDVRRAGVERYDAVGLSPGGERQVGDAAEVQQRDPRARAEEHEVRERNQRGALAASRDVRAPEVGDRRHAGAQRGTRLVAELERRAPWE